jgi:hypothetical protein
VFGKKSERRSFAMCEKGDFMVRGSFFDWITRLGVGLWFANPDHYRLGIRRMNCWKIGHVLKNFLHVKRPKLKC